jgi:hypothetical protein
MGCLDRIKKLLGLPGNQATKGENKSKEREGG